MTALVSILIPHYKTLDLTKLCLRSLRKYTDLNKVELIVIDNNSMDESIDYLRSLNWITLIERKPAAEESPPQTHANALDLALKSVTTPYVLSIHTDTIACHPQWLDYLLNNITEESNIAGVGNWKLEYKPILKRFAKSLEGFWQTCIWFPLTGQKEGHIEGRGKNYYYLRSHCALYQTNLIKQHGNGFNDGQETAGKVLHKKMLDAGYQMLFLASDDLSKYILHFNHATMILNPEISGGRTGTKKERKRIEEQLNSVNYKDILLANELDQ